MSDPFFSWAELGRGLLEVVFPPQCGGCGDWGREPFCRVCSEALEPAPVVQIEGADATFALWTYGGPVVAAIRALKFEGRRDLAQSLGRSLLPLVPQGYEVIVPVPMSSQRLRQRGYNQARELARPLGLKTLPRALVRTRAADPQVGLDRQARLLNLRGALGPGPQGIAERSVILLDDVITTGATAYAAVTVLRSMGAKRVAVLALAQTP